MRQLVGSMLAATVLAGLASACFPVDQQAAEAATAGKVQACSAPKEDGTPLKAPELAILGHRFRDEGLQEQARATLGGGEGELKAAASCYGRALQLSPESYDANLGLGVTYLARARLIVSKTDATRATFLNAAKGLLGYAYMLRHGAYEPLYYLAEAAVLQEDFSRATAYLEVLKKASYKLGPVFALYGFIAEQANDQTQAAVYYEMAMNAAWPQETVDFVSRKVEARR